MSVEFLCLNISTEVVKIDNVRQEQTLRNEVWVTDVWQYNPILTIVAVKVGSHSETWCRGRIRCVGNMSMRMRNWLNQSCVTNIVPDTCMEGVILLSIASFQGFICGVKCVECNRNCQWYLICILKCTLHTAHMRLNTMRLNNVNNEIQSTNLNYFADSLFRILVIRHVDILCRGKIGYQNVGLICQHGGTWWYGILHQVNTTLTCCKH